MKYSRFLAVALIVGLLVISSLPVAAQGTTGTSTAFVLQNLGDQPASAVVEFRDTAGNLTKTYSDVSIGVGASFNMDQRYATGDPGVNPFQGSVIASSDQPLGSVVNLMRTGGVPSFESYNGLSETAVGKTVRVLQVLKAVSSGGLIYNTSIAIQNTDPAVATQVNVTFTPDPTLNPAVGGTITAPVSKSYPLAGGATLVINQASQTDPNIGAKFFGSVTVVSTVTNVGVVTTSDGGGNQLLAYPSYAGGTTNPIGLPSVYKNIASGGDSYSTAFLIANLGNADATVTISYIPMAGRGTVSGTDTVTIPQGTVKNIDQRFDAPSITSATFMGAALVTPSNGQPVAVMANLRGGSRYAMTYGGLTNGVAAGGKLFLPVGYKNIASGGLVWSSTIAFYSFTPGSTVRVSYIDNRSGVAPWTSAVVPVETGTQIDLRFDSTTAGHDNFFGGIVVEVVSGEVGAIVQSRGLGGSGDALMAYQGLSQ